MKNWLNKNKLWIILLVITLLKIIYISDLPVIGKSNRVYDESLMTDLATNLKNGEYLGTYGDKTLIKGIFYPAFMALLSILHIPYLLGLSTIYALACFLFTDSLKNIIKKPGYLACIYVILLMNPTSFAKDTYLVLYRNSLGIIYALLFVTLLIKLYQSPKTSQYYKYGLLLSIIISIIYFTRGDAEWTIIPVTLTLLLTVNKQRLWIFPILISIPLLSILTISSLNQKYYHLRTDNEMKHSAYTKAFQNLLFIDTNSPYDRVSITHETLNKAINVSPTLQTIKPELDKLYEPKQWATRMPDGTYEIENAYMIWALRDAASQAGIYQKDAKTSNDFWSIIATELDQAFQNNLLPKRVTPPSILLNTPSIKQWNLFINNIGKAIYFSTSYQKLYINIAATIDDKEKVENLTHNKVVNENQIGYQITPPYQTKLKVLTSIKDIYHNFGWITFLVALICYIIQGIKRIKHKENNSIFLIATILLTSYITIIISIAYTHTFSFDTISAFYLNPVYSLQIAFITIELIYLLDIFRKKLNLDRKL